MVALLRADRDGFTSVEFMPHDRLDESFVGASSYFGDSLLEMRQSVESLSAHLWGVEDVYFDLPERSEELLPPTREPDQRAHFIARVRSRTLIAALLDRLRTPLALPVPLTDLEPKNVPESAPLSDRVNQAYLTQPDSTMLPLLVFLAVSVTAALVRVRRIPRSRLGRRLTIGAVTALLLVVTLLALAHAWHLLPDQMLFLASRPGTTLLAAFSACLGAAFGFVIQRAEPERAPAPERDNVLGSVLVADKPVDDVSRDRLGFAYLVGALRRFLDNVQTAPPVVIGVNGPWGSGKSSLMRMLTTELEKTGRFSTVWYNAWQYQREEQVLAAFLQSLAQQLAARWGPTFALRLGWCRFKQYSYAQYVGLLGWLVIGILGAMHAVPQLSEVTSKSFGEATAIVLSFAGAGSLGLWLTALQPFRKQLLTLSRVRDQSRRIGFIEEFNREFRLYRTAVGEKQKFLIVIDDLDRCPPDQVVEVLKAVNLIITSSEGAGRSFFVLGFDPQYLLRSIELYYRDYAKSGEIIDRRFAPEYLKKMITVSVSVPASDPKEIRQLVDGMDGGLVVAVPPSSPTRPRWQQALASIPEWWFRLALAFLTVALVCLIVAAVQPVPQQMGGEKTSATVPAPESPPPGDTTTVDLSALRPPPEAPTPWWSWLPLTALGAVAMLAAYRLSRAELVEPRYVREPADSERFQDAIKRCTDLLPANPRDAIRTVNLMRMEYLVQAAEADAERSRGVTIPKLDEWECVTYTLLQQRHGAFRPEVARLFRDAHPNGNASPTSDFYRERMMAQVAGLDAAAVAADIAVLERDGGVVDHLTNPEKIRRFVDVNWFTLDVGWKPEAAAAPHKGASQAESA